MASKKPLALYGGDEKELQSGDVLSVPNGIRSTSSSAGMGYDTGAGGSVTQATSKSTAVTLNAICGAITTNNASLATNGVVVFTVNNSAVAATDVIALSLKSGSAANGYMLSVHAVAAGSFNIMIANFTGGARTDTLVINFAVIKAVIT